MNKHTKLDKMTLSKSLKKLEKEDLVLRAENETDTRAKTIALTDDGVDLAMKSVKIVEEVDKGFFSTFSQQEKEQFNGLFLKLLSN